RATPSSAAPPVVPVAGDPSATNRETCRSGDDGECHVGRVISVGVDRIVCNPWRSAGSERLAGVRVWVVAGNAAGGELHAEAVPSVEDDGGGPQIEVEPVDTPWLHSYFAGRGFAEPGAEGALDDVER